jgi:hypothetical protein
MTRHLSELLQIRDPQFQLQLRQLERASGYKSADIRLSVEIIQAAKQKIRHLGLDQHDTTGEELYHALQSRITADDQRLERALRTRAATYISAEADLVAGLVHALQAEAATAASFSAKSASLKRLLKKTPPKRLLKQLGYRSLDAMLRHEMPAAIVGAARLLESTAWRRAWQEGYKQLTPADFESRTPRIIYPTGTRWSKLTEKLVLERANTVVSLPELGTIIILPFPKQKPAGMVVATAALALEELNTIGATANYLRASQVHGDFASRVQAVAAGQVHLESPQMPQAMPWHLVQRYFAATKAHVDEDIFGPYVQATDFAWHAVEQKLAGWCPSLEFWEGTSWLSFLHEGKAVSMNIVDAAINACNGLTYEALSLYHAQQSLWGELTLRYLDHKSLEQAVASVLQPKLALEPAVNE